MMNNKMKSIGILSFIAILGALVSIAGVARQAEDPGVLLRAAIEKEEVDGDLPGAIDLYKQIVAKHGDSRAIAAKALLRLGGCYEKLGEEQSSLAQKAFEKVIENYPDQTEAVNSAKAKLAVFLRARALIEKGDREFKITKVHAEKGRGGFFSPDGKKLALIDQKGNTLNIWLRDIASGKEVRILSAPGDLHDCFWSPDSQWIAYINGTNSVCILSVEGGQPKTIIEGHITVQEADDYVWPMGWTSDSKKLIVQDTAKGLFAIPAAGGNLEEIYRFPDPKKAKERDEWLTLSPDGKLIAYQSTQGGNQDIYVMPVQGGEPVRITDDAAGDSWPRWSYDGQWLAFDSARTGSSETWVIRITPEGRPEGQPSQATRGGKGGVWTQDGKIAYSTRKTITPVFVADADGSGEVRLTKFNNWNVLPRWSPDAKTIVFVTEYGEEGKRAVWTVPSSGGEEKFLVVGDSPAWSSDGRKIAFSAGTGRPPVTAKISVIPAEGGEAKELMNYDGALTNLDWSPDGRSIAFSYARGKVGQNPLPDSRMDFEDIYIISTSGGEPKRLTRMDKKGFRFTSPRFSPDGKKIAFRSLDYEGWEKGHQSEPVCISTIDIEGGEPKLVTNEFSHWWFCWSPDGKNIISSKQEKDSAGPYGADRRLYKVSAEGGTPERLNILGMMPEFAPGGKKIAYSRLSESSTEFWMAENFLPKEVATKKVPQELTIRKVYEGGGSSISSDGRYVSFTDENNLAVRDLTTGKTRRLTEKGSIESLMSADRSVFSPDGQQIAYEWYEDKTWDLRLIGLDGSGRRVLVHRDNGDYVYPLGWSPDGKRIFVGFFRMAGPGSLTGEIAFVSVADGTVKIIKPTHETYGSTVMGMNLSPDGRYIAYHAAAAGGSKQNDLFLLSSDGSRDAPLLEHPANDRSPVWTPDGKRILFISDRAGAPGFWMIDVVDGKTRGEPRLVKADIGDIDKGLGFTPQGAYYYALSVSMGDIYVAELNAATGKIEGKPGVLASRFARKLEPAWSPDGQHLAFYRRTGPDSWAPGWRTIFIRSCQTGEERELANSLILSGWARWFPDGRSLLVSGGRSEKDLSIDFYRVDVETGETSLLMKREGGAGSFWPGLSPDGKTVFFTYYKREPSDKYTGPGDCFLGSYQIETRQEKEICPILPRDQRYRQSVAVSPDGRQLAFVVYEGSWPLTSVIKVVSPKGGEPRELFRSPWPGFIPGNQGLEWTPDGRYLLVVRGSMSTEIGELLRIPAQGGEAQEMGLTAKRLASPSVRPDGKQLAYHAATEASNEIWVMENFLKPENK